MFGAVSGGRMAPTKRKGDMKPEQHRKAAADLRKLAGMSSKPDEKQNMLDKALQLETLATVQETWPEPLVVKIGEFFCNVWGPFWILFGSVLVVCELVLRLWHATPHIQNWTCPVFVERLGVGSV